MNLDQVADPEPQTITHFSHPHPLRIFNVSQLHGQAPPPCSGCKFPATPGSGSVYCCSTCNFFLHGSCSKLPQQLKHPVDRTHILELLPRTVYSQGFFYCDACGKPGTGFLYHCGLCNIDLHTTCAMMPLARVHPAHPHWLYLTFSPPYPDRNFSCDVCKNIGSNHWLYRCGPCNFDTHLSCVDHARPAEASRSPNYQQVHGQNVYPPGLAHHQELEQSNNFMVGLSLQRTADHMRALHAAQQIETQLAQQFMGNYRGLRNNSPSGGVARWMHLLGSNNSGIGAGDSSGTATNGLFDLGGGGDGGGLGSLLGDFANLGGFDFGSMGGFW